MNIYEIMQAKIRTGKDEDDFDYKITDCRILDDGRHIVSNDGTEVPIEIRGNAVTLFLGEISGDRKRVRLDEFEVGSDTADQFEQITRIDFSARGNNDIVSVFSSDRTTIVAIVGSSREPKIEYQTPKLPNRG